MPENKKIIYEKEIHETVCFELIPVDLLTAMLEGVKEVLENLGVVITGAVVTVAEVASEIISTMESVASGKIRIKLPKVELPNIPLPQLPNLPIEIDLPWFSARGSEINLSEKDLLYRRKWVSYRDDIEFGGRYSSRGPTRMEVILNQGAYAKIIDEQHSQWGRPYGSILFESPIDDRLMGDSKSVANFFSDTVKQYQKANNNLCVTIECKFEVYKKDGGKYYAAFRTPQAEFEKQISEGSFTLFTYGIFVVKARINDLVLKGEKLESFRINIDVCLPDDVNDIPGADLLPDFIRKMLKNACQRVANFQVKP